MDAPEFSYGIYLQIPKLLDCQRLNSEKHDEYLFIIIHQVFELWFGLIKQDLYLGPDSVRSKFRLMFSSDKKDGTARATSTNIIINKLDRVVRTIRLSIENFHIIETMPALNFVDFRDTLTGGSGFQSLQFRQIEIILGLKNENRKNCGDCPYLEKMAGDDQGVLATFIAEEGTIFDAVDRWLAQTPGIDDDNFWQAYAKNKKISGIENILQDDLYQQNRDNGDWLLSQAALKGALLITIFQDEPVFQASYKILSLLIDIDGAIMVWRARHIQMVHRMIGQKVGTGGSSGYDYLCSTFCDDYKIYRDLFKLSTYLMPREERPPHQSYSL